MEMLKWIGAVILAVIVIGICTAVVIAVATASALVWGAALVITVIFLTARLIKDLIEAHNEKIEDL
jgi:hypothetical protein